MKLCPPVCSMQRRAAVSVVSKLACRSSLVFPGEVKSCELTTDHLITYLKGVWWSLFALKQPLTR